MTPEPVLPPPLEFLFDADGKLDHSRLRAFALNAEMDIYAVCGIRGAGSPTTAFVVAATSGDETVLVTDAPIRQVHGPNLPDKTFTAIAAFIERNRLALRAHWEGELDSVELSICLCLRKPLTP